MCVRAVWTARLAAVVMNLVAGRACRTAGLLIWIVRVVRGSAVRVRTVIGATENLIWQLNVVR